MTTDRENAAASLSAIEQAEQRTSQAILYGISSSFLILWGLVTAAGYVLTQAWPRHAVASWTTLTGFGFVVMALMIVRNRRRLVLPPWGQEWRIASAQVALTVFGLLVVSMLGPFTGRQLDAFWALLYMLGFILAGIWFGRFFVLLGLSIAILTITGFWLTGPWYPLWMAAVDGGALMLAGLWLRRQGAAL